MTATSVLPSGSPPVGEFAISAFIADTSVLRLGVDSVCRVTTMPVQEGVELLCWSGRFAQPMEIPLQDDSDRIHFSFNCLLQGQAECEFTRGGTAHAHRIAQGSGNISFGRGRKGRYRQQGLLENVTVMVRPDVLAGWDQGLDRALDKTLASGQAFLEGHAGGELHATALALSQSLRVPSSRHPLWLQAQALAIVSLFLESRSAQGSHEAAGLQRQRLLRVRDRLLCDLTQAPALADLAREACSSVPKLERDFRKLFGHSVYGLFQHERMQLARRQLLEGGRSVTRVASELGYTNVSHFAAAFRKQFDVPPSTFKPRMHG